MPRLTGIRGSIYLAGSGTKIADSFLWEFEENQEILECSIKGETFRRYAADVGHARVRIQAHLTSPTTTQLTLDMNNSIVQTHGVGTRVAFILETVDAGSSAGQIITGAGYLTRSQIHVGHDGMITEELEIEVDGALTGVV